MEDKLKVAVFGAGYGRGHVASFARRPDVEVVAVWSRTEAAASALADEFDIPHRATEWRDVLTLDELDAVSIATPVDMHYPIAVAAMERGCHVLCEKPLALTLQESQELVGLAAERNVVNAVNFDWRMVTDARTLNRVIREKTIGDPTHARLTWLANTQPPEAAFGWRHTLSRAAFGVLGDFHHMLDEIHWHFGAVQRLSANCRTIVTERGDSSGTLHTCDADDAVSFIAITEDDVQVSGLLSRCAPRQHVRSTECFGVQGAASLSFPSFPDRTTTTLLVAKPGDDDGLEDSASPGPAPVTTQDRFVAAILDRTEPVESSFADGVAAFVLAEAMRTSSSTGRWIDLPDAYLKQEADSVARLGS
jgi:predicted dehydrogenase